MKKWITEIKAICPASGDLLKWAGPYVPGETIEAAQAYCEANELGYCRVTAELLFDFPESVNAHEANLKHVLGCQVAGLN